MHHPSWLTALSCHQRNINLDWPEETPERVETVSHPSVLHRAKGEPFSLRWEIALAATHSVTLVVMTS